MSALHPPCWHPIVLRHISLLALTHQLHPCACQLPGSCEASFGAALVHAPASRQCFVLMVCHRCLCSVQVLKRSLGEVDSVFSDPHIQPSVATIGDLPYLEAVVLETLRLRPPAYIVGRCASRDVQFCATRQDSSVDRVDVPAGVR